MKALDACWYFQQGDTSSPNVVFPRSIDVNIADLWPPHLAHFPTQYIHLSPLGPCSAAEEEEETARGADIAQPVSK